VLWSAICFVPLLLAYCTHRVFTHLFALFVVSELERPDVGKDLMSLSDQHSVDPELLAVGLRAMYNSPRDDKSAITLKRTLESWIKSKRVAWSEAVRTDQLFNAHRIAFSYTEGEKALRNWWGLAHVFGNLVAADRSTKGDLGGGRILPSSS